MLGESGNLFDKICRPDSPLKVCLWKQYSTDDNPDVKFPLMNLLHGRVDKLEDAKMKFWFMIEKVFGNMPKSGKI